MFCFYGFQSLIPKVIANFLLLFLDNHDLRDYIRTIDLNTSFSWIIVQILIGFPHLILAYPIKSLVKKLK